MRNAPYSRIIMLQRSSPKAPPTENQASASRSTNAFPSQGPTAYSLVSSAREPKPTVPSKRRNLQRKSQIPIVNPNHMKRTHHLVSPLVRHDPNDLRHDVDTLAVVSHASHHTHEAPLHCLLKGRLIRTTFEVVPRYAALVDLLQVRLGLRDRPLSFAITPRSRTTSWRARSAPRRRQDLGLVSR